MYNIHIIRPAAEVPYNRGYNIEIRFKMHWDYVNVPIALHVFA